LRSSWRKGSIESSPPRARHTLQMMMPYAVKACVWFFHILDAGWFGYWPSSSCFTSTRCFPKRARSNIIPVSCAARKGFELAETLEAPVTIVFVGHPKTGELVTQDTIATYAGEVKTDVLLRQGDPVTQILAAADEVDAGLIVVGNKGMVGAKGFLMGSVPQEVCERSTRDVLIARTVTQVVSELSAGEGGIVERAGEKLAVYVDDDAEAHVMSARCTHMGCTVKWNPGEHTFDCPCHGSRFGPTGEVVNGPAARPLPPA